MKVAVIVAHLKRNCFRNKENKAKVNANKEFGQAFVSVNGDNDEKDCWLIDSGASHHICSNQPNVTLQYSQFDVPKALRLGDGGCMYAEGQGQENMEMLVNDVWKSGHLANVCLYREMATSNQDRKRLLVDVVIQDIAEHLWDEENSANEENVDIFGQNSDEDEDYILERTESDSERIIFWNEQKAIVNI
ncbi:hypothetical protein QE152_g38449 [Popillia japonica]|uniref:Retrovirus-related Pol polyprotein from transposon TNT 1-94-like beta-barrel domain-containing protein n=1 Tax=Popillia japonica TaxID=7064 RepID=A0AAW1HWU3_POPJA